MRTMIEELETYLVDRRMSVEVGWRTKAGCRREWEKDQKKKKVGDPLYLCKSSALDHHLTPKALTHRKMQVPAG